MKISEIFQLIASTIKPAKEIVKTIWFIHRIKLNLYQFI